MQFHLAFGGKKCNNALQEMHFTIMRIDVMSALFENYTIAFDLDGTLVDTAPDLVRATNEIMDILGLGHCELNDMRKIIGKGARNAVITAARLRGRELTDSEISDLLPRFLETYEAGIALRSKVYDGANDALALLKSHGAKLLVCTNKPTKLAQLVLKELGILHDFAGIFGPETTPRIKPDPIHITNAIERIGGNIEFSIMVGDSENDVIAARAANLPVVVTTFGYTEKKASDLGADAFFSHYDELFELLLRLIRR